MLRQQCRGILLFGAVFLALAACTPQPQPVVVVSAPQYVGPLSYQPSLDVKSPGTAPALQRPGTGADFASHVQARVLFPYDSAALDDAAIATLDRQADWLRAFPEYRVLVEGHADERGDAQYNLSLGLARAEAARNRLVASGVEAVRIVTMSYGATRPVIMGNDESAWAQNRRAVTVLLN